MSSLTMLLMGVLVIAVGIYAYAYIKIGKHPVPHLSKQGAWSGIVTAILVFTGLVLILSLIYPSEAKADRWFAYTSVAGGLDTELNNKVFCYSGDTNDRIVSNLSVEQNIYEHQRFAVSANYTHHSCAFNKDKPTYDAVGLQLRYTFRR